MLAISLLYIVFIMLRYIPSIPSFLRAFFMKGYWVFLHLLRWICDLCPLFCLCAVLFSLIYICWPIL
jgi:hypothetical protein